MIAGGIRTRDAVWWLIRELPGAAVGFVAGFFGALGDQRRRRPRGR